MKKNFWMLVLIGITAFLAVMTLVDYAKPEKITFKEVTNKVRNESDFDWRESYTDYGDFCVNWYYEFKDDTYSLPLYEVVFKNGKREWSSKEAIMEMFANRNQ